MKAGASFTPPLAVYFVWNHADNRQVWGILDAVRGHFARDVEQPFSRALNVPLFFYSSDNAAQIPADLPIPHAEKNVVFVFASKYTTGCKEWRQYIGGIARDDKLRVAPIAIDQYGTKLACPGAPLAGVNFLRARDWGKPLDVQRALLAMTHEVYRCGFAEMQGDAPGKESSVKIFASHTKRDSAGERLAMALRQFVDNTNMSRFFDAVDIAPGFHTSDEIEKHIEKATLVAFETDSYYGRYWCQREILLAKRHNRPVVVVDCLAQSEDRIFPAAANVPCVRISPSEDIRDEDILHVLNAALLETVRFAHTYKSLAYYQEQEWIPDDCLLLARPPEVCDIEKLHAKSLCYPEPALYREEADWLGRVGIRAQTPLEMLADAGVDELFLQNYRVGISISDCVTGDGYARHHLHEDHSMRLSQDIARHLLAHGTTLVYGGDLRDDGFTQFILDEANVLRERLQSEEARVKKVHVENHLAWPLQLNCRTIEWEAKYSPILSLVKHNLPDDLAGMIDKNVSIPPTTPENRYVWSRCLSEMRACIVAATDARVCAGGKLSGYKGKMPGVLEEIILAVESEKPVYLLGAFGGVAGAICDSLFDGSVALPLTEAWQLENNCGYGDLQTCARADNLHADYDRIEQLLLGIERGDLAYRAGLTRDEYCRLMRSPFVDECVHLILWGLHNISRE